MAKVLKLTRPIKANMKRKKIVQLIMIQVGRILRLGNALLLEVPPVLYNQCGVILGAG